MQYSTVQNQSLLMLILDGVGRYCQLYTNFAGVNLGWTVNIVQYSTVQYGKYSTASTVSIKQFSYIET